MTRTLSRVAVLSGLLLGATALAQPVPNSLPQPRITSVFPPGAQAGRTLEVVVNGGDLDDADRLYFAHPGIKGEVILPPEPPVDPKKKAPAKKKKAASVNSVKCKITVDASVPVGQYDLRISNQWGVSNPRSFCVGDRPEVEEREPNDDAISPNTSATVIGGSGTLPPKNQPLAQRVALGTTVNGIISKPTDVDYILFRAQAKQRLMISCLASSIDSRAQPLVEVYDDEGRRLAMNRNYEDTDALVDVTIPADGDYFIRVCEFAYLQGGPDYFYRLTIGAGPWIDSVFPPAVKPGQPTTVTIFGRNLPGGQPVEGMSVRGRPVESITTTVTPPSDATALTALKFSGRIDPAFGLQDGFEFRLTGQYGKSNPYPIFYADDAIVLEKETGIDKAATAQVIPTPCEVMGRIDRRQDRDFYRFTAKKGDVLMLSLFGERIGATSDFYLRVRDEKEKELAGMLDDDPDALHPVGFYSRTGDPPAYRFTAPADGQYTILVGSLDSIVNFGPRCGYRLRIAPPRPDYRAVVMSESRGMPCVLLALPGGESAFDVFIHRMDGFREPVQLTVEGLPPGVTAKPSFVGTDAQWGSLVLSADAGAKAFTGPVTVKCTSTINGKPISRTARPASIVWGNPAPQPNNNNPLIARGEDFLLLAVRPEVKARFHLNTDLAAGKVSTRNKENKPVEEKLTAPVFLKPGDKVTLPVKLTWLDKEARANVVNVRAELTHANPNADALPGNNKTLALAKGKDTGDFPLEVRANATPGVYSLVLKGDTQISFLRDPEDKGKKANANVYGYTAPIEITVLPASLAKLTVQGPSGNQLKLGMTADLTVKVDRQGDYEGEFKVHVELPKNTQGVTVKDVTLPAGQTEVKVPITVAANAKPGTLQNIVVTATGIVHKKFDYTTDTKLNLNIVK